MSKKPRNPNFDQLMETLRSQSFTVTPAGGAPEQMQVSKYGAAAVLTPGKEGPAAFIEPPGALINGEVASLLDRGYQKFFKTSRFELPATAAILHGIHQFTEELKLAAGSVSLFNESLGTTSDLYHYDRIQGREAVEATPARPWEQAAAH